MSLRADQLITFATVAQEGSVTTAAHKLHRSQPAISAQLLTLQETLGERLYSRQGRGITLTPAGHALLPYAQALSRALQGAQHLAAEFKDLQRGRLRVAASMTVAVYLLPNILARFVPHHPQLDIQLLTRNTQGALALLRQGEADLALIEGPIDTPLAESFADNITVRTLLDDEITLVVRPDHPLAGRATIHPTDLQGLRLVQREPGSGTREVVERALAPWQLEPAMVLEATGLETVKEAVLQGLGAAFISRLAVARELDAGLLEALTIEAQGFRRPITLLTPQPELCSRATRAFLEFLSN